MDEKTLKQLTREYEQEMPQEILKIINEFDWKRELRGIVRENNLMLDVGTDLEESVYLMLLGAIKVEDVYDRMIDTHELPNERVQKVLHEIELKIFNPLSKKITEIGGDDEPASATAPNAAPAGSADEHSRDSILAEIEDEELDTRPMGSNIVMPGNRTIPGASMERTSSAPEATTAKTDTPATEPQSIASAQPVADTPSDDRLGLRGETLSTMPSDSRPFSISQESMAVTAAPKPLPGHVEGIQQDPVAAGLTKSITTSAPVQPPRPIAADPYREPIE